MNSLLQPVLAVMLLAALSFGQATATLFISGNNTAAVSARKVMKDEIQDKHHKRSAGCENLILVGSADTAVYVLDVVEDNNEGVSATLTEYGEMVWSDTYRSRLLGRGGLFGNSPDAVNLNGTLLVGKLCKAFKEGKIKSLPAPSSTPGRAPEPAIESPVDQAKHAQQYADCLKLAVDNPSMVCKQEASGASMREPEASTSQPSARGTIGASSDGNLGVRHDASMAEPEASTSQPTAKGTIGASSDGNPRVQHAASMPEPEASTSQPTAHGTIGASCDGNRLVRHDGVTVSQVVTGGPAAQVGIEVGDVILAIDDHYLYTIEELNNAVDRCKPGSTIKIRYRRYSMTYEAFLIVGNREAAKTEH